MDLGQLVRRWGLAVALAATSLLSWQAAERRDTDNVSQQRLHYDQALGTAMLSARRVPRTIQAPVIDDRIRPSLETIVSGSPSDSCLMVRVGDRILAPAANVKVPLIPASNQKVLTTYVAMVLLGSDFRYRTTVRSDVEVVSGVIDGNLYLIGDGDPFLSTDDWWSQYEVVDGRFHTRLEDLADEIVAAGVTAVTGQLIGDESLFDSDRIGPWAERLIAGKQSGPLSALTVNEGFVSWPEVYAASSRSRSETENPPLHAASVLFQLLLERGITIGGVGADTAPQTTTLVAAIESPPLVEIVTHINSYSSNIGAELLLKRIGHSGRAEGSTAAGAEVVLEELARAEVPTEGLVIHDGSGLAETNRLTCEAMNAVLATAGPGSEFAGTLAIGAERGSLAERFGDSSASGRVMAKTGTLNDATALSGYVRSATDGETYLTFAYLANEEFIIGDVEVLALQDPFVIALTGYPGSPAIMELSPVDPVPN